MRNTLLLYLCVLDSILVFAQETKHKSIDDHYTRFDNLSTLQGLSNNKVLDIKQDDYGYIWVATADGLNRYDGYRVRVFRHNANDSLSISNNYITSLALDALGNMWVGTKNGLNKYNPDTESFFHYPQHSKNTMGLSNAYVRKVYCAKKSHTLWVETVDGVLNKIRFQPNSIKHFPHQKMLTDMYDYHSIFEDANGAVWLGGRDMGPYVFDTLNQKFTFIEADYYNPKKKRDNDVACVFQDSKKRFWMSATDGFYQYFPENNEFKKWYASSTFNIIESYDASLWLATGNGLCNFIPERGSFTFFRNNKNDMKSLADNHVYCVFLDATNNLWIGTNKGVSILHYRSNVFKQYRNIPETEGALSTNEISCFLEDSDGTVWVGSMEGGLYKWDRAADIFIDFKNKIGKQKISCLYEDANKDIWIGLWSGTGFYKYNKRKNTFTHYVYNSLNTKSDWYSGFYEDSKKRLWVGFWGNFGIHFFNRELEKFEPYSLTLLEGPLRKPLKIIEVDEGNVWCPNYFNYLHRYNMEHQEYEVFVNADSAFILPEWRGINRFNITDFNTFYYFLCSAKDEYGTVYFATNNGLIVHKNGSFKHIVNPLFNEIKAISTQNESLFLASNDYLLKYSGDTISKLMSIEKLGISETTSINKIVVFDTLLWIGSSEGLYVYNLKSKSVEFTASNTYNKSSQLSISDIIRDSLGNYWVATTSGLLNVNSKFEIVASYNLENSFGSEMLSENIYSIYPEGEHLWLGTEMGLIDFNMSNSHFTSIEKLKNTPIYQIRSDNKGSLWLATEKGLVQYHIAIDSVIMHFKKSSRQLTSRLTQFVFGDKHGFVWVGTTKNGLNRINPSNFEITHYLNEPDNPNGFWGNHASCIYECFDGTILIGGLGINIYDYNTNKFKQITTKQGLISNTILGITQDEMGFVWISTDKGLMKLNMQTLHIEVFAEDWGLTPNEFNRALYKINSGEILIASDKGFYKFNPHLVDSVRVSNKIEITNFKVFDKVIRTDFTTNKSLVLNYDENFFTFEFADFNFLNTTSQFLYKLEGVDEDWVKTDNENRASYTKIEHGKYTFLVTTESNLAFGLPPEKISLSIIPPFWLSKWFIGLEICLGISFLLFIYVLRTKQFKQREKQLQLEQKLLRSQMDPHFVFNALIAIQSFIFKNNAKEAGRYLSKFAKLMRLFLQNTRFEFIPMSNELETLVFYMELQRLRFNDSFDFSINCVDDFNPELILLPPMMAQPFIENSIEHGFKGIKYQGSIAINYSIKNDSILISIKDNGKGLHKAMQESDIKKHTSLATTITRERLDNFNKGSNQYYLKMLDLSDIDKTMSGTEVVLNVPYKLK